MNNLIYDYYTGWPVDILKQLSISLSLYGNHYNRVKIGITSNPEQRYLDHKKRHQWEKMIVKY